MLIVTGASFMLVLLVDESSLPDVVPHADAPLLLLSLVSVAVLAVLLFDPTTCDDVFGAPLWLVVLLLLAGFAVDLTHPEAGSVMGPTLLAALFFVTLGRRARAARWTMAALIVVFVSWDLVALVDPRTFELEREAAGGGLGRVGALGLLLCSVGVLARSRCPTLRRRRESPECPAFRSVVGGARRGRRSSRSPSSFRTMISATDTRGESGASR